MKVQCFHTSVEKLRIRDIIYIYHMAVHNKRWIYMTVHYGIGFKRINKKQPGRNRRRNLTSENSEKFWAPCESQTHDPLSSSLDALINELLCSGGSIYGQQGQNWIIHKTSHKGLSRTCLKSDVYQHIHSTRLRLFNIIWKEKSNTTKLRKNSELQVRIKLSTLWVLVWMLKKLLEALWWEGSKFNN